MQQPSGDGIDLQPHNNFNVCRIVYAAALLKHVYFFRRHMDTHSFFSASSCCKMCLLKYYYKNLKRLFVNNNSNSLTRLRRYAHLIKISSCLKTFRENSQMENVPLFVWVSCLSVLSQLYFFILLVQSEPVCP